MSPALRTALLSMGWSPERRTSIDTWIQIYDANGYTVVPEAINILQNFGGLTIHPIYSKTDVISPNPVLFDPSYAAATVIDRFEAWQAMLGLKLTPVAEDLGGLGAVMVTESGSILGSLGTEIEFLGTSLVDALENFLVFGKRKPVSLGCIS